MLGRKILFLAAGYVAGNVVSSLYTQKKWKDFQTDIKKAKTKWNETEVFVKGFVSTQKSLLSDLESLVPKQHKKLFEAKKKEAFKAWSTIKKEGVSLIKKIEQESKK